MCVGVRHSEELSLCKPVTTDDLKYNYAERQMKKVMQAKTLNGQVLYYLAYMRGLVVMLEAC